MWRVNRHLSFADLLGVHPTCFAKVLNTHQPLVSRALGLAAVSALRWEGSAAEQLS